MYYASRTLPNMYAFALSTLFRLHIKTSPSPCFSNPLTCSRHIISAIPHPLRVRVPPQTRPPPTHRPLSAHSRRHNLPLRTRAAAINTESLPPPDHGPKPTQQLPPHDAPPRRHHICRRRAGGHNKHRLILLAIRASLARMERLPLQHH